MAPFRLLHCLTHSTLGGGQELVLTLSGALLRRAPEVQLGVVLPAGGPYVERFRALGAAVHEAPLDSLGPRGVGTFRSVLQAFRPDVVHSHGKGAGLFARTLAPAPRIHSYHGFFPPAGLPRKRLYLSAEKLLLRRTEGVIAVSEAEAEELRKTFPRHAAKVTAIPNVVDRAKILAGALAPPQEEIREFLGRHGKGVIVTMVARDDPAKNYPLAAEACAIALAEDPTVAVMFVGAGNTPEVELLRREFSTRFLAVPRLDTVGPAIRASSILLLTSVKEGGRPLVIQEAFVLGKPVVATDVPGIRETVRDGWNGILCRPEAQALSTAILRLVTSERERRLMGEQAAAGAAGESLGSWVDLYLAVYQKALGRAGVSQGAS
jgi:glycosyltransferase involved in cell wall biosynthesis